MNILALDLSLTATGWAVPDSGGRMGTISFPSLRDTARVVAIVNKIMGLVTDEWCSDVPDAEVVMEDLPFGSGNKAAGSLGMLHGAVRYVLWNAAIPFSLVTPASLKKYATGKGNATKPDMRMAMYQRVGLDLRDDNQVDAWWLLAMACDHYGEPLVKMPASHRVALDKVVWV